MNSNLLPNYRSFPSDYIKGPLLGIGGFAKVYACTIPDSSTKYAVKIIEKSSLENPRYRQKLSSEIKIQKSLSHPHILKLHSHYEDSNSVYLLLEFCSNNSLSELLKRRKRITEKEAAYYAYQLLLAVKHIHDCKVIHRDIKLGNLLLTDKMEVKLADFGLAAKLEYQGERKRTICGTPNYIAPEILEGCHSYEADIWSFGVLIYTLLYGFAPFQSNNVKSTYQRIRTSHYSFPENIQVSQQAKDLLSKIFVSDPEKRISVDSIFAHDFFTKAEIPIKISASAIIVPPKYETIETSPNKDDISTSSSEELKPEAVSVEKWIICSGNVAYLLNNNLIGVLFEDGITICGNFEEFCVKSKKQSNYTFLKHPEELKVKIAFFRYAVQHFQVFTREIFDKAVYVKKICRKELAVAFKLSNNSLQVSFQDKSQLILMNEQQELIYITKSSEKSVLPFSTLQEITSKDLITRVRFTHSILKSL